MKRLLLACAISAASITAYAQDGHFSTARESESELVKAVVETRMDHQSVYVDGMENRGASGFKGKYLFLKVNGEIAPGVTYAWRQHFNKPGGNISKFSTADWLYVNYKIGKFDIQAGKEVTAIGGYEYDADPTNIFASSVFWQNIPCFNLGVQGGYQIGENDKIIVQAEQSPFATEKRNDLYGFSAMWMGNHGPLQTLYSVNNFEYDPGKYITYIALGNKISLGKFSLEADVMNRSSIQDWAAFKDMSAMAKLYYSPNNKITLFGKYTYDVNKSENNADKVVLDGTELNMAGGGIEYYPVKGKKNSLRLHAASFYYWGVNTDKANFNQDKTFYATAGVTWYMNLFNLKK